MSYGNDDFVPVILGTNVNAYNIARSLHEAFGVRSLALGRFALRETAHSKIIDVRAYRDFEDPDVIVATLQALAAELPGRKRLLIATIEFYTNVLIDRRAELEGDYVIPLVGAKLADRLMNKTDFYRTCAELGIPHPATLVVGPGTVPAGFGSDLPFRYPVIVKPSNTDTYPRIRFEGKQKIYLVDDAAQLRSVVDRVFAAGYTDDLIVQEYIAGDETVMRVANTYSDSHGTMRFLSMGQVALTEYDPKLIGNNNAIITMADATVATQIRQFLDSVGYVGTANFDIMYDRRDGTNKILEMNLRQGATSYYTMAAGGNITRCYVDDFVYGHELPVTMTTAERLWVNVPYLVLLWFAPRALRPRIRAAARRGGTTHTLRYRPDRSLARRVDIARVQLRHTLDYVKYAKNRPR